MKGEKRDEGENRGEKANGENQETVQ